MTSLSRSTFQVEDRHFRWESRTNHPTIWRLFWKHPHDLAAHLRALENPRLTANLFPFQLRSIEDDYAEFQGTRSRPLSLIDRESLPPLWRRLCFESLGTWLRALHDQPAPEGFGAYFGGERFQTFNALMAHDLQRFGHQIHALQDDAARDQALELLSDLRCGLNAFHPHGRSVWTLSYLSANRLAIHPVSAQIEGIVDLSGLATRPPEFDLGALTFYGLLENDGHDEQAFWKGYRAVLTRDLERRIHYFQRYHQLRSSLGSSF